MCLEVSYVHSSIVLLLAEVICEAHKDLSFFKHYSFKYWSFSEINFIGIAYKNMHLASIPWPMKHSPKIVHVSWWQDVTIMSVLIRRRENCPESDTITDCVQYKEHMSSLLLII